MYYLFACLWYIYDFKHQTWMPTVICERLKFKSRGVCNSRYVYVTFGILSIMLCVMYTEFDAKRFEVL
jgi:hypothetical protein